MGYATLIIDESAMIGISPPPPTPTVPLHPYRTFSQTMSSPAEVLKQLYSRYVGALQGASDFLRDDLPSASPGVAKWAQETGRRACRKYARQRGSIPFLTSDPSWDGICSGYWGAIGEGPISGGSYAPPFTGGQCAGVSYFVRQTRQNFDFVTGNLTSTQTLDFVGGPGPATFSALPDLDGPSLLTTGRGNITFADSNVVGVAARTTSKTTNKVIQSSTYAVLRTSGGNDTCGDPPGQYAPPTFPPNLPNLPTPPTNPAPGFGNNWDVDILPDGQVSICVGGECSTGTPPGGGGGPDSGGGPGEPDGPPQENDPNDPDSENEITGCVEDGNILTGLRIELTDIPSGSKVTDGNYYGVCWVYMGPDSEKLDMISDGRWVYDGQFFLPDSDSCTCYKVKVRYPWGIRVQAFSRPKEE